MDDLGREFVNRQFICVSNDHNSIIHKYCNAVKVVLKSAVMVVAWCKIAYYWEMTHASRTLVTFESNEFEMPAMSDEDNRSGECGEDVCQWLMKELRKDGVRTDANAGQEDYGWYFNFWLGDTKYCLVCGLRPAEGSDPAVWVAWIERSKGFVAGLFGGRETGIDISAARQIHQVLSRVSQISNVRWHLRTDFDRGIETSALNNPE